MNHKVRIGIPGIFMLSIMIFAGNWYYWRALLKTLEGYEGLRLTTSINSLPCTLFWALFHGGGASIRTAGSKRLTHSNSQCLNVLNLELRYCLGAYRQLWYIISLCREPLRHLSARLGPSWR